MNLSTLIGKPVLTRSGDRLGYVTAARPTRDLKKLSSLICADENEDEFYLPARAILSAADAVIAGGARLKSPTGIASPVGRRAYSHTGEEIGALTDAELGETPVLLISSADDTIRCEADRATLGETVIVYPTAADKRPASPRRARPRRKPSITDTPAQTAATPCKDAQEGAPCPAPTQNPPPMSATSAPKNAIADEHPKPAPPRDGFRIDRTNLLGRRVKKSVYDETGAPIILAGERITPQTLTLARRKNKLLALTVNTLTNLE